jgi:very-short-patch-repair endonuclease
MVDVATSRQFRSTARLRVHARCLLTDDDVTTVDGIPVTTVARTLVDLADVVGREQLRRAIEATELARAFDLAAVEAALARVRGRRGPGPARLRAALAEVRARGVDVLRSAHEAAFRRLVERHGLPRPRFNAWIAEAAREADALFVDERVIVEIDPWSTHGTRGAFHRDRARDAALAALGYLVIRLTPDRVADEPRIVADELRAVLAARAAGQAAPCDGASAAQ